MLFAAAFAAPVAETDRPHALGAAIELAGWSIHPVGRALVAERRGQLVFLAAALLDRPVVLDGVVFASVDALPAGRIERYELGPQGWTTTVVAEGGRPDRLVAGDGAVAWVSGVTGLSSLWLWDGQVRQLTNIGLTPPFPARPPGFVAPPLGDSLWFDGPLLRWESADGAEAVRW